VGRGGERSDGGLGKRRVRVVKEKNGERKGRKRDEGRGERRGSVKGGGVGGSGE